MAKLGCMHRDAEAEQLNSKEMRKGASRVLKYFTFWIKLTRLKDLLFGSEDLQFLYLSVIAVKSHQINISIPLYAQLQLSQFLTLSSELPHQD